MAAVQLPSSHKQVVVKQLGTNFSDVTAVESGPLPVPEKEQFMIKTWYVGVNASDVNFSTGRIFPIPLPFVAGLEAIGEVVSVGENSKFQVGQKVACLPVGAFAQYVVASDATAVVVPSLEPEILSMFASGLTASIALEKEADLKPGKKVLVTAAAGGTGQYAVQLAKLAGCHVIGTCSGGPKTEFLKRLGCDRVINYKEEDLNRVLSSEYPEGIDVIYESIGKDVFKAALNNLAQFGRLLVIGQISSYKDDDSIKTLQELGTKSDITILMTLLVKSASVRGFLLSPYIGDFQRHIDSLVQLRREGKIKALLDNGERVPSGPFRGVEKIPAAVDHLYSQKSLGKVVVDIGQA